MPIGFVLFYNMYSKHIVHPEKYWKTPLHSWGLPFLVSQCLWSFQKWQICLSPEIPRGGSKVASKFSSIFPAQSGLFVLYNLLGGLCSCPWVFNHLTARIEALLWAIDCPSFTCDDRGSGIFGGTDFLRTGKSVPCLLFLSYHDSEGINVLIPFFPILFVFSCFSLYYFSK